ncbi:uncharacterized protein V1510DRAFT_418868 [Dipodascopsis tothii]|uniref:uncharacterized protein n=1 Tax=Dipodascopsis tothii TaxID=44089 RepID=UPI0034CFCA11
MSADYDAMLRDPGLQMYEDEAETDGYRVGHSTGHDTLATCTTCQSSQDCSCMSFGEDIEADTTYMHPYGQGRGMRGHHAYSDLHQHAGGAYSDDAGSGGMKEATSRYDIEPPKGPKFDYKPSSGRVLTAAWVSFLKQATAAKILEEQEEFKRHSTYSHLGRASAAEQGHHHSYSYDPGMDVYHMASEEQPLFGSSARDQRTRHGAGPSQDSREMDVRDKYESSRAKTEIRPPVPTKSPLQDLPPPVPPKSPTMMAGRAQVMDEAAWLVGRRGSGSHSAHPQSAGSGSSGDNNVLTGGPVARRAPARRSTSTKSGYETSEEDDGETEAYTIHESVVTPRRGRIVSHDLTSVSHAAGLSAEVVNAESD